MPAIYREEHPLPQWMRDSWVNLNGEWEFEFDDSGVGEKHEWQSGSHPLSRRIQVPFAFQSKLSGIGDADFHDIVWYRRTLAIPETFRGKRILLHFGAVDYEASVWVNGIPVARHEGGHTPFQADVTHALQEDGRNTLVVRAVDYSRDLTLPRGKQFWLKDSAGIWYTRTTGIWQTVWMEAVNASVYLDKVKFTPDLDRHEIGIRTFLRGWDNGGGYRLKTDISFNGAPMAEEIYRVTGPDQSRSIRLDDFNDHGMGKWWTPDRPNLYEITFTLLDGDTPVDVVSSYFGMRKISVDDGVLRLNNRRCHLKFVLDQGYFPDGNLTPPSDDAIRKDVELTKAMGFNGARKHQKLEDPRYLYWCDRLGLMVWSEAANACDYSEEYVRRFTQEWLESVERDYNHPSIIAWVPINESWGVPNIMVDSRQQHHALAMYHLTKSLDPTRLVVSNDGWEMVKTDLYGIHDYESGRAVLEERYGSKENAVRATPAGRELSAGGFRYEGQPILVTEFGGIAFKKSEWEGWGYSGADSEEDFERRLRDVIQPLIEAGNVVMGYCYTQLTDVEQEINGLLTYDGVPKLPLETIRAINEGR